MSRLISFDDMREILKAERLSWVKLSIRPRISTDSFGDALMHCTGPRSLKNILLYRGNHEIIIFPETISTWPEILPHILLHEIAHAKVCKHTPESLSHTPIWEQTCRSLYAKYNLPEKPNSQYQPYPL